MMTAGFAKKMHCEAEDIAKAMATERVQRRSVPKWSEKVLAKDGSERTNVVPFQSPYANFDPEVCDTVVLGISPGGNPRNPSTIEATYLANLDKPRGEFNAYLHDTWEHVDAPGKANLQQGVQRVFQTLYDPGDWEQKLRSAASFNVCPLRTGNARHTPKEVWEESVEWCQQVLEHLRPTRIICFAVFNEDGKPAYRSPWHSIDNLYQIENNYRADVNRPCNNFPAFVLAGYARTGALSGCEVIGIPHLSYHHRNKKMYDALREYLAQS